MLVKEVLLGYADDLNDINYLVWSKEQLLRWHNEAMSIIASLDPNSYTKELIYKVNPCTIIQTVCDCIKIHRVIAQVTKDGKLIKNLILAKNSAVLNWVGKPITKRSNKITLQNYSIDKTTNALQVFPQPSNEETYILVECSFTPANLELTDEIDIPRRVHLAAIRQWVSFSAKMVDQADTAYIQEAQIHYKSFFDLIGYTVKSDNAYKKLITTNTDITVTDNSVQ